MLCHPNKNACTPAVHCIIRDSLQLIEHTQSKTWFQHVKVPVSLNVLRDPKSRTHIVDLNGETPYGLLVMSGTERSESTSKMRLNR